MSVGVECGSCISTLVNNLGEYHLLLLCISVTSLAINWLVASLNVFLLFFCGFFRRVRISLVSWVICSPVMPLIRVQSWVREMHSDLDDHPGPVSLGPIPSGMLKKLEDLDKRSAPNLGQNNRSNTWLPQYSPEQLMWTLNKPNNFKIDLLYLQLSFLLNNSQHSWGHKDVDVKQTK